jgi:hypothetical protein
MRCSSCGHVMKVQKGGAIPSSSIPLPAPSFPQTASTSAHTVPLPAPSEGVRATSAEQVPLPAPASSVGPAKAAVDSGREWKIRQPGGQLFTFRELTTLQKWIVERKVNREDEISLNGESWRKLGAIGELTIFFQVVDEAQRAAQLTPEPRRTPAPRPATPAAPAVSVPLPPPAASAPASAPSLRGAPVIDLSLSSELPQISSSASGGPSFPGAPVTIPPPPIRPQEPGGFGQVPLRPPGPPEPTFSHFSPTLAGPGGEFDEFDSLRQSSRAGRNLALGMLGLVGVLGAFYLYRRYDEDRVEQDRYAAVSPPKSAPEPPSRELDPRLPPPIEAPKKPEAVAEAPSTELPREPPKEPLAATPEQNAPVSNAKPSEERRDFDWLLRRADKLREQEKPEDALEMYGKAADLRPNRAEAVAGKGLALFDMGQKLPAEAAFKRALELDPKSGTALIGLAETYRSMQRLEEAIAYYEKYLNTLPDGPEAGVARSSIRRLRER